MKYLVQAFVIYVIFASTSLAEEVKDRKWVKSPAHKYIASQETWFNTEKPIKSEDLMGRIILLHFWNPSCISCLQTLTELDYLKGEYGDNITIIAPHVAKFSNEMADSSVRDAVLKHDIEHLVVNDVNYKIWSRFDVHSWPAFVLIAPNGQIHSKYLGDDSLAQIENDIYDLLEEFGDDIVKEPIKTAPIEENRGYLNYPSKFEYVQDFEGEPAIFIADSGNNRIVAARMDGSIFMEIGSGHKGLTNGEFWEADFNYPQGMLYRDGILYIADTKNHIIRAADFATETVSTLAGNGFKGRAIEGEIDALSVEMSFPYDLAEYPNKDSMVLSVAGVNQLWLYDFDQKKVAAIAGNGAENLQDGAFPANSLARPAGFSVCDKKLYFADASNSAFRVFAEGEIKSQIGFGTFKFGYKEGRFNGALMQYPLGLYCDEAQIYVADSYNNAIRQYDKKSHFLRNFSGDIERGDKLGKIKDARYNSPSDIIKIGDLLYIIDSNNHKIKTLDLETRVVENFEITPPEYEYEEGEGANE